MREPAADSEVFGLIAEFATPADLLQSVAQARQAGFLSIDTYSPFPIDGLSAALGFDGKGVPRWTLAGGVLGLIGIFGLQYYTNWRYQIEIGGRPLYTWPAFLVIAFDITLLVAAVFSIGAMFLLNRLPRLHYPLFDDPNFHLASDDKFFLVIFSNDDKFDVAATQDFLDGLGPKRVNLIRNSEEPE
jgi:hypothetical protein